MSAEAQSIKKVGIAGCGAIGSTVANALIEGIDGLELYAIADPSPIQNYDVEHMSFENLCRSCDLVVEALPPSEVPHLFDQIKNYKNDVIIISSCAFLMFPDMMDIDAKEAGRIYVPSGALAGIDGVKSLKQLGIKKAQIKTIKAPQGFSGAPYVTHNKIPLDGIDVPTRIFKGNALEAAKGFPANVNVAATLSMAGIGPESTEVEIWADPQSTANTHEILVEGEFSRITSRIENFPDPNNPKSSMLAAASIIAGLKDKHNQLILI